METSEAFVSCTFGGEPYRELSIQVGDGQFGFVEWSKGVSTVYVYREVVSLPLGISGVILIQVAGMVLLTYAYVRFKSRFCRFAHDIAEPYSSERADGTPVSTPTSSAARH